MQPDHHGGQPEGGRSAIDIGEVGTDDVDGSLTEDRPPELSAAKRALLEARRRRAAVTPKDLPADGPPVLSSAQERVWLLDQVDGGTAAYNAPRAIRIRGPLDSRALRLSLDEIVRRHEVLRTVVELIDGAPTARILDPGGAEWSTVDVSHLSGAAREARVRELVDAEVQRPFALASDVLLRALLVQMGPDEHVLVIVSHHVASDDRSKRIVAAELEELYRSYSEGTPASVPTLPLQFGQFARWEQARLTSPTFRKDIDYWKQRLSLLPPPLELPTDFLRPSHWNYEGATFTSFLDAPVAAAVKELTVETRATLFIVLEAAFAAMVSRVAASDDVVIGTPVSGRTHPELDDLVGYFSNTLVMRHDLGGDPSFRELVDRVRGDVVGAFEHQSVPFERLVEELGPERDPGRHPFFQVMFTLRPGGVSVPALGDLTVTPFKFRSGTTKFDLSLITIDEPSGVRLVWEYSTKLFAEETIARLAERFQTLLLGALAEPDVPVKDLPLVGPREMAELLEWGSGPVRHPGESRRGPSSPRSATPSTPTDRRWRSGTPRAVSSRSPSWMPPRPGSVGTSSDSASPPATGWGCSWTGRWTSSAPWWRSSGPEPPTCRSTPTTPKTGWRSYWPTPR